MDERERGRKRGAAPQAVGARAGPRATAPDGRAPAVVVAWRSVGDLPASSPAAGPPGAPPAGGDDGAAERGGPAAGTGAPLRVLGVGLDDLGLLTGVVGVAAAVASLWPDARVPAWPAASAGLLALACARARGRAVRRGLATFLGLAAALVGGLQIAALWLIAAGLR